MGTLHNITTKPGLLLAAPDAGRVGELSGLLLHACSCARAATRNLETLDRRCLTHVVVYGVALSASDIDSSRLAVIRGSSYIGAMRRVASQRLGAKDSFAQSPAQSIIKTRISYELIHHSTVRMYIGRHGRTRTSV